MKSCLGGEGGGELEGFRAARAISLTAFDFGGEVDEASEASLSSESDCADCTFRRLVVRDVVDVVCSLDFLVVAESHGSFRAIFEAEHASGEIVVALIVDRISRSLLVGAGDKNNSDRSD